MTNENIGYIICESAITVDKDRFKILDESIDNTERNITNNNPKRLEAEVVFQRADEVNRNHRIYPKNELFPEVSGTRIRELIKARDLRAETGHPMSKELSRQQTIDKKICCSKILDMWTEDDLVVGRVKGTYNSYGEEFDRDLRDGTIPAWSLRALGTVKNTARGAEVHNLKMITYDNVIYPSHPGAYTRYIVSEGVEELGNYTRIIPESVLNESANADNEYFYDKGLFVPINTDSVIRYIKQESSNIKSVLESMDTLFDSITLIDNSNKVQMTTYDGNTLIINLESYIHNEIMSYCESKL